jgi:NAD(P)-dependent dehydrogenase (short-subunit alcohol dehydrogenase family)
MALLDGKVALISGVGGGQSGSHAVRLAEKGADIIGVDTLDGYETMGYRMATEDGSSDAIIGSVSDQARYMTGDVLPVDLGISNKAI